MALAWSTVAQVRTVREPMAASGTSGGSVAVVGVLLIHVSSSLCGELAVQYGAKASAIVAVFISVGTSSSDAAIGASCHTSLFRLLVSEVCYIKIGWKI